MLDIGLVAGPGLDNKYIVRIEIDLEILAANETDAVTAAGRWRRGRECTISNSKAYMIWDGKVQGARIVHE